MDSTEVPIYLFYLFVDAATNIKTGQLSNFKSLYTDMFTLQ